MNYREKTLAPRKILVSKYYSVAADFKENKTCYSKGTSYACLWRKATEHAELRSVPIKARGCGRHLYFLLL